MSIFRGFPAPASLKRRDADGGVVGDRGIFRGFPAPASLKHVRLDHGVRERAGAPSGASPPRPH